MKSATRKAIRDLLTNAIQKKLEKYKRESTYMPFAVAMFGEEAILTGSMLQSFYTTFGMSTYEQMAVLLAKGAGYEAEHQYELRGSVDSSTGALIDRIVRSRATPDTTAALRDIRTSIQSGRAVKDRESVVDVFIKKPGGEELYIDIATAKPNKKEFQAMREKLLRWYALRLSQGNVRSLRACIGIPYNPYHPKPYERWTGACCDVRSDLLVQEQLWAEVAGENVFSELLSIFDAVGKETGAAVKGFLSKR